MAWQARYEINWGHKVASRGGPVEVTRQEYNEQAGAETPPQPEIPVCGEHVWQWWWELNARRPPGFENLAPFSYTEIYNWILLTGLSVSYRDIRWLVAMDNAWLEAIANEKEDRRRREKEEAELNKGKGVRR